MRKRPLNLVSLLCLVLAVAFLSAPRAAADDEDPPSRVARLSHVDGSVSFQPAGTDDWLDAVVNRPLTTGDKVWADNGARAELHLGSASLRIGSTTGFNFLNLTDNVVQIQITEGTLRVRVKHLDENETFEVDTPNLAFSILRPGIYRLNVNEAGDTTMVSVRGGEGEVTGGGQAYTVNANQTATFAGTDQLNADVEDYAGDDDFDNWCNERDHREDHSASIRYVSPEVVGYEDLDDYGGWRPVPEYGTVWFPQTAVGWAPYRYGHWAYIAPWGYTWVEDEPWGYAPFHYGRWVNVEGAWGWVPAPPPVVGVAYVRPVYAPALVAFVGGPGFAVGVGVGAAVSVGWFPLGPREVYVPSYPVSRAYVTNINVTNTRVETTVVNNYYTNVVVNKNTTVTNVTYVNRGGVTATNGAAFAGGQSVSRNVVKVDAKVVASAPVAASAPAITPTRQAVLGTGATARAHPPAALATRAVVAKTAPPPPPVAFEKRAEAIRANGGRPLAAAQTRQLQPAPTQAAARPNVKIAPAAAKAQPITAHPATASKPGQPPSAKPPAAAANKPAAPNQPPPAAAANKPAATTNQPPAAATANKPPATATKPANVPPAAANRPPAVENGPANAPPGAANRPPAAANRPANTPPPAANKPPAVENRPANVPPAAANKPPVPANRPANPPPARTPNDRPATAPPPANNRPPQERERPAPEKEKPAPEKGKPTPEKDKSKPKPDRPPGR
jgi:hypothetical protein